LLELSIKKVGSTLHFTVSDNGKGFDAATVRKEMVWKTCRKERMKLGRSLYLSLDKMKAPLFHCNVKAPDGVLIAP
jgi:signal transduction histidine kinase